MSRTTATPEVRCRPSFDGLNRVGSVAGEFDPFDYEGITVDSTFDYDGMHRRVGSFSPSCATRRAP
jgi:hypothetical protein